MDPSRRLLLQAGLALPAALVVPQAWPAAKPTPACGDGTPKQSAGPFYTPDTPAKLNFRADDPAGAPVNLRATVLDMQCRPIPGAVVDLWHANSSGDYDNDGFRLRGHQRADGQGAVRFETVLPGRYPGRTRHFHVRIFGPKGGRLLTTQLYFPGDAAANEEDWLFERELLLQVAKADPVLDASFAFVVDASP